MAYRRFKELFGFNVPPSAKIVQYENEPSTGYCAFNVVFHEKDYDDFSSRIQNYIIRQYSSIEDAEKCKESDDSYFRNIPVGKKSWYNATNMTFVEGYMIDMPGHLGAKGGTLRIAIVREEEALFHAMIEY